MLLNVFLLCRYSIYVCYGRVVYCQSASIQTPRHQCCCVHCILLFCSCHLANIDGNSESNATSMHMHSYSFPFHALINSLPCAIILTIMCFSLYSSVLLVFLTVKCPTHTNYFVSAVGNFYFVVFRIILPSPPTMQ